MRVWERLIKWADDEAQSARAYRRLAEAAELHAAGSVNLWRDPELQLALDWRDRTQPNETWASRYHSGFAEAIGFLTASSEARDAERAERESQRQRERDAEREKVEAQARNARRLFRAAMATGAVAVVAIIAGVVAIYYFEQANKASLSAKEYLSRVQITESRSLVKTAEQYPEDQTTKILLGLEALPDSREGIDRPFFFGAHKILADGVDNLLELAVIGGRNGSVRVLAVTPDGRHIVTGSDDQMVRMYDAGSGAEIRQFKGHAGGVLALAVTSDGRHIVTGSDDNTARVWDASNGVELLQLKVPGAVRGVAVTPDGTRIITASDDNIARVWDAGNGTELRQFRGHTESLLAVAAMPDGRRIVTGSDDKTARVWDVSTGAQLLQIDGIRGFRSVAVTPDGSRIITGSEDNTARLWDASSGAELRQFTGHKSTVTAVTAMLGGDLIVTGSEDSTSRIWNAATGVELFKLDGHTLPVTSLAVTPDSAPHHHRFDGQHHAGMGHQSRHCPALAHGTRRASAGGGRHIGRVQYRHGDGRLDIVGVGCP